MTVLVLGPNGSGKSLYAEKLVVRLSSGAYGAFGMSSVSGVSGMFGMSIASGASGTSSAFGTSGTSGTSSACSVSGAPCPLFYIATMIPYREEGQARVAKHRKQRESMGFTTVEKPFCVAEIPFPPDAVVLLEDVSNLLSNALFDGGRNGNEESVLMDIKAMCAKCRAAVLVSINGLTAEPKHNDETRGYIDALNRLNKRLSDFADTVISKRDEHRFF